jgi:putative tRNA adenosine deaminase-associated protein
LFLSSGHQKEIDVRSAVALRRSGSTWRARDIDLDEIETLDDLTDQLDDFDSSATDDDVSLVFIEEDDEWLGLLRISIDTLRDPRIFLSDSRVIATSAFAEQIFGDALPVLPVEEDDSDEDTNGRPDAQPVGDAELLADLGTPGDVLVEIIADAGALPSDVVATICERAGCLDALDELRGA